jgi:oxygen-independent coproporphyrinogen-3 oxidase
MQPLGVYISVPFCKAKCTFCNFASDAFAPGRMESYTERLCQEIASARDRARELGVTLPESIDSVYFGGGTPSLLSGGQMRTIFERLHSMFHVKHSAEITLECAPGQLSDETLDELLRQGMNRVSFGVQSFVDAEASAVGRLHTRAMCLAELERVRSAGIREVSIDLIAGLPLQTEASWRYSVGEAVATGVPHISVYMLEVDEESRLGREAIAGGSRYGAGTLPSDEQTADWYLMACELLEAAGVEQYEISNFARSGHASRHNLKYWQRYPYVGFGLDAHSMFLTDSPAGMCAVRTANADDLDAYMGSLPGPFPIAAPISQPEPSWISREEAFEEAMFLGLRLNTGIDLTAIEQEHGAALIRETWPALDELQQDGLLAITGSRVCLTGRGRLLSNDVFSRLLVSTPA